MPTRTGFVSNRPLRCVLTLLFAASALLCLAHNADAKPPYPIILAHGLISSNEMWGDSETGLLSHFRSLGWSKGGVIHFQLGQEDTLSEVQMLEPEIIDNSGDIWLINFKSSSVAGSNAAPIYLQARALQLAIAEIRKRTHSSKVVLIGHSMGGLAAAAYLSGHPNPSIVLNPPYGYQNDVAKLLTLGTPFAGSGYANWLNFIVNSPPPSPLDTTNALRDLSKNEPLLHQNVFLFGGIETEVSSNFISKDVNCDGDDDDRLDGIHSLPETAWPQSVSYFWIVGDLDGRDGDCIVSPESQNRPFGERKTIDAAHTHAFLLCEFSCTEAESFDAIIEGLDEPDDIARAWLLPWGSFDGFITHQGDGGTSSDQDYFKFRINGPERIAFTFQNALVGDVEVEIRDITAPSAVYSEAFPVNGSSQAELLLTATSYPRDFYLIIRGVAPASGSGLDGDSATRACDSDLEFLRRPYNFTLSPLSPSRLTLSAAPTIVPPGGLATLRAQVQEANGTPLGSGIEVSFSPVRPGLVGCMVRGSVCVTETDAAGVAEARFSTAALGTYEFSSSAITGGSATASVQVKLGGISASASPNPVTVNLPSTLNVTVTDGAGQPVTGQAVTFRTTHPGLFSGNGATSATSPSSVLTDSNGQTWIRFTPMATGTASLTIETANASAVLLSLQAIPPAGGLNLSLSAGFLFGDAASSTYEIEALVTDAQGNPVLGEPVQFTTARGLLSDPSPQTGPTGITDTNLTVNSSGDVTVTAKARDTSAATTFFAQVGSGGGNQMTPVRSFAFTDDVYGLSFTPDGSTLLVADYTGHLKAWNTVDWSLRWETDATSDRTVQISLPPSDSTKFLVMHGDGADIRRVSDGGLICRIVNAESKGVLGAWTSGSSFLGTSRGKLYRHGTQCSSGTDVYTLSVDESIEDQAHGDYHVQKDMFAACVDSGAMIVWNKNGTFIRRLTVAVGANAYDTDFNADGSKLAAVGYRSVKIFDTSSWSATSYAAQALPDHKYGATFLDNDSKLAVGSEGKIEIVNVAGGASFKVGDINGRAWELAWNPQTGDLAVGTSAGMVQIFKPLAPADTLPPTLSISDPPDGFTTDQAQLTTRGRVTDASGIASFQINGAPVGLDANGNFSHTVTLSPGANTVTYSATDLLGQVSTAQRSGMYLVDTAPPVISGVTVTPSSGSPGTSFEIRCTVIDGDSGVASVTAIVRNSSGTVVATRLLTAGPANNYFTGLESTGLIEGTYWVDLEAVDSSPAANIRTLAGAVTFRVEVALEPPAAPTWLRTTATSPTTLDLLWDDNATNEDGIKVERKVGPAGPWTLIATLPANATTYQDSGLTCGMAHAYRVWAFNNAGNSGTTNEAAATPECGCVEALSPESLTLGAVGGTGSFGVTACGPWTAASDESWIDVTSGASGSGNGTVGFRVERNNVQSPRTGTIHLPELGLTFTVSQATAPADPGFSSFLGLVSGTVAGQAVGPDQRTVNVAPGAPLSGTLALRIDSSFPSNAVMALGITPSWGDHATSYNDLGHFSTPASGLIRNVNINSTAPSTPGTYHVIAAYRGEFNAGQVMSATNWGVGTLVWNNGDDVAGWSAEKIGTANRDGNVLTDYFYGSNIPTWMPATAITVVVEAPAVQPPAAPSWLRTTPASESSIDLLWDDNANNEDGFKVERKIGPAGPWTLIATLPANTTTYQDSGLTCGTAHAYRVWAFNAAGDSGMTNEAAATPECESILLSEDFEDGAATGWQNWISGWSESGSLYHATNTGANLRNEAVWSGGYDWSDYSVEADVVLLEPYGPADGQLLVRYNSETDRISCRLFQSGASRELQLLVPGRPLLSVPFSYNTGQRYRLRASAVEDSVTCEVVGNPATRLTQSSLGSRTGTVGLRNTHIPVDFDDVAVFRETDRTLSESFESGDPSVWTSGTGAITVRPGLAGAGGQARYLGSHGLEIAVDGEPAFVQKDLSLSETSYRARFAVNLKGLNLAEGDEITLFAGYEASGDASFRIAVRRSAGSHRLTASAREDGGSAVEIPSAVLLAPGWRIVEIHWKVSSGPAHGDGALDLWVDGTSISGLAGLDNDLQELAFVSWGRVDGAAAGSSGSLRIDDFESRRSEPIGPPHLFTDVPVASFFWPTVQGLYAAEITAGCAVRRYCPDSNVTRAEMAIFLVRAKHGSELPLPAPIGVFSDVPTTHWAAAWIEQLRTDGITQGCATQPLRFCPGATVTRAEMAIFLLRARHGAGYAPPPAIGTIFSDVPVTHWAASWIEQLYAEGITSGCAAGTYCPGDPVTRIQMAAFLVRTFSLPTQQPRP